MIARNPNSAGFDKADVLIGVVARVLSGGADEFEVKFEDGQEHVFATKGLTGFFVASFPSDSQEAAELRKQLCSLTEKPAKINIRGVGYKLVGEIFDCFGEDAFRVTIRSVKM